MNLTQTPAQNNLIACELLRSLGYSFKNARLLDEALTHRSFALCFETTEKAKWNERLEFLGDGVLGLVISDYLYAQAEYFPEGDLSRIRASLVNEAQLADLARGMNLGSLMRMGPGEVKTRGFDKNSVIADALEAVFGAIFLDGGFAEARQAVLRVYDPLLAQPLSRYLETDYKTKLQEWTQRHYKEKPTYLVVATSGPAHTPEFEVAVEFRGKRLAIGVGQNKKLASQAAAKHAFELLQTPLEFENEGETQKG